jgi:alpha,alpha-trehalase
MFETAKGMARNLASMVERFGYVPNGGRIYYKRSQPPVLGSIIYSIYEETDDLAFVRELLPLLEKEFQFWEKNRNFKYVYMILIIFKANSKSYRQRETNKASIFIAPARFHLDPNQCEKTCKKVSE